MPSRTHRIPAIARLLALLLMVAAPTAGLGAILWGYPGAAAGVLLADLFLIIAAFRSDRFFARVLRASREIPAGLDTTLRFAHEELVREDAFRYPVPRFWVYPDALPNALTVRSLGSEGSIFISQGLLGILSEAELRAVIRESIRRIEDSEWLFNSLCASLASRTLRLVPAGCRQLFFAGAAPGAFRGNLGVTRLVTFLLVAPLARLFLGFCGESSRYGGPRDPGGLSEPHLVTAMRKAAAAAAKAGMNPLPGAAALYLVGPGPADRILEWG